MLETAATTTDRWFADPLDHLSAELRLLDLLLLRAVVELRAGPLGQGRTPHEEIDTLLAAPAAAPELSGLDRRADELRAEIDAAAAGSAAHRVELPLPALARRLRFTPAERQVLVLALAPELDRRYDRIYHYLTGRGPEPDVELAVRVLASTPHERWRALRLFSAHAPLHRSAVLQPPPVAAGPVRDQPLRVAPRVVAHLLGDPQLDAALAGVARRVRPRPGPAPTDPDGVLARRLAAIADRRSGSLVIHVHGRPGAGRTRLVHAVAARIGEALVELDASASRSGPVAVAALREGELIGAPVLLAAADELLADPASRAQLDAGLARHPGLLFVTAQRPLPGQWRVPVHEVELPAADTGTRRTAWSDAITLAELRIPPERAGELAGRFRLTPGQIRAAARDVAHATGAEPPTDAQLADACHRRGGGGPGLYTARVPTGHGWADLVLEQRQRAQLGELCDRIRFRERVLDEWGLGRRVAQPGLVALFCGTPGTGKTMAAGVVARELGLQLHRVDLSQVVSKYIGETEKNLERVLTGAEAANAVLLFDEADALFGRRTQIGDAHDRYANIETSYLLQRMESFDGIAVLATNLRQNLDEAFLRRLAFVVEFPFPGPAQRRRIWQGHLSGGPPLAADLDLELLAGRLEVPGGGIRNIVVAAAFHAAADGRPVGMSHLLRAARSEYEKTGKMWPELAADPGGSP